MERPHRTVRPPGTLSEYVTVKKSERNDVRDDHSKLIENESKDVKQEDSMTGVVDKLAAFRPYKCKKCPARFKSRVALSNHVVRHTGSKPYTCFDCGKCLSSQVALTEHSSIHTNARPHRCEECGKESRQLSVHLRHQLTHQSEFRKPFDCTICGRQFIQNEYLKQHMRMHTGEKPFSCEKCDKSFPTWSQLRSHKMSHSSERPHVCPECNNSFKLRQTLVKHMKIHYRVHPLKPGSFTCSKCGAVFRNDKLLQAHCKTHEEGLQHLVTPQDNPVIVVVERSDQGYVPMVQIIPKESEKPSNHSLSRIFAHIEHHSESEHYSNVDPASEQYRNWLAGFAYLFQHLQPPLGIEVCKHLHHMTTSLQLCLIHVPGSSNGESCDVSKTVMSNLDNITLCKDNFQYKFIFEQYAIMMEKLQFHFKYYS